MKQVFLLFWAASAVLGFSIKETPLHFVDAEGNPRTVDFNGDVNTELLAQRDTLTMEYWLYTRSNPNTPQMLVPGSIQSIMTSNFDINKETVFVVHGWVSNGNTQPNPILRNSFLTKSDVNFITVDWRRLAYTDLATASAGVPILGAQLGAFVNWLGSLGLSYDNVHLVGFCLGAHLVGRAGIETGGRVARVTGLSPPRGWESNPERLSPNDAVYVEAVHTNGGASGMGMNIPIAHVDFFPNAGTYQPGCFTDWLCHYNRAWQLFDASVTLDHLIGYRCDGSSVNLLACRGESLRLGNDNLQKTATPGSYYVTTYRSYPY